MPIPIAIKATELFNETTEEFIQIPATTLILEHSLLSVAKWEEKHHKPYLTDEEKTPEEFLDYIRCMIVNKNVSPDVVYGLTEQNLIDIKQYMEDSHTATWFREDEDPKKKGPKPRIVTAELVYCWMIQLRMPVDIFQKWHIGRLITLIRVCQEENKPPKDKNAKPDMNKRRALMEQRRAKSRAKRH